MLEILTNKKDRKSGGWPLFLLSCYFKWYIAVPAYHVDLLRRPDDRAAYRADVLDAPVLAGLASSPDGGRGFLTAFVAVALGLDLEQGFAAGSNILHAGLLGQPRRRFRGQRRDRPAVGGVLLDVQAVSLGRLLEFHVVVVAVVAHVLDVVRQVVEVRHLMEHGRGHLANGPVNVLGADIDFPVRLAIALPDFIYAAPAIFMQLLSALPHLWYADLLAELPP